MNTVVFRFSKPANVYTALLVAGLLVFVWLHWRGERQVALVVFSVLTLLAASIFTVRGALVLSPASREITARRTWLGIPVRKMTIRVGADDALYLTEDVTHNRGTQGIGVSHRLEASGELLTQQTELPGPYILISESPVKNRAVLEAFAEHAAATLGVELHDTRKFSERVKQYRAENGPA